MSKVRKHTFADGRTVRIEVVNKDPRMAVIRGLLSEEEADGIAGYAKDQLHPSRVVAHAGGLAAEEVSGRTSWSCRVPRQHPAVLPVIERISEIVKIPLSHTEPIQVVHYDVSQEYRPHHDWFDPNGKGFAEAMARGGQRLISCFCYLADVEGGGHTDFPALGMSFKPKKGEALIWYNMKKDGTMDTRTLHAGAPVTAGEKYGMNVWFREHARDKHGRQIPDSIKARPP